MGPVRWDTLALFTALPKTWRQAISYIHKGGIIEIMVTQTSHHEVNEGFR